MKEEDIMLRVQQAAVVEATISTTCSSVEQLWQCWCDCQQNELHLVEQVQHDFIQLVIRSIATMPSLAGQQFQQYDSNGMFIQVQVMPFHLLLLARAPLSILQSVYQHYQPAIQQELVIFHGHFHGLPLHWACRYGVASRQDDIMGFLIREHPRPLFARHDFGRMPVHSGGSWPLHMAFQCKIPSRYVMVPSTRWHSLKTFQQLWQAGPKTFLRSGGGGADHRHNHYPNTNYNNDHDTTHRKYVSWTPLEWALYTHQSVDIVEYFVQQFLICHSSALFLFQLDLSNQALRLEDTPTIVEDNNNNMEQQQAEPAAVLSSLFDQTRAELLLPVVARLQTLQVFLGDTTTTTEQHQCRMISPAAWKVLLLQGLQTNTSITQLVIRGLSVVSTAVVANESFWWNAVSTCLEHNATLQELDVAAAPAAVTTTTTTTDENHDTTTEERGSNENAGLREHQQRRQQKSNSLTPRPFLYYIARGIQRNPHSALQSLTLQGFTLPNSHVLCQLLGSSCGTLQTLKFQSVRMVCDWDDDDDDNNDNDDNELLWGPPSSHHNSNLQRFVLSTAEISTRCLQGLMSRLATLPSLIELTMWIQYQEEEQQQQKDHHHDNATQKGEDDDQGNNDEDVIHHNNTDTNEHDNHNDETNSPNDNHHRNNTTTHHQHNDNNTKEERRRIDFDFTNSLSHLLVHRNRLETLFFACKEKQGPARAPQRQLDLMRFCQTTFMRGAAANRNNNNNTSLQRLAFTGVPNLTLEKINVLLETLQHHNATLTEIPTQLWVVRPDDGDGNNNIRTDNNDTNNNNHVGNTNTNAAADHHEAVKTTFHKIAYWLQLNQHGRAQARDSETTKEQLVDLLCSTTSTAAAATSSNSNNNGSSRSRNGQTAVIVDPFVIQYGLLREMPSIWI